MTLGDCISGAMIAGVVDIATSLAIKRDRANKGRLSHVKVEDFREAVQTTYLSHVAKNASFDLDDFIETKGIDRCGLNTQKLKPEVAA